ncbi:hypothetical protein BGW38_001554 [Lunasporangiospora selenospora]|uniref:Uncharacterized protein n=1 Tax=Lunasporangiospora selenospora TaxID=979761 RepID=A0A9P6KE16_9FUNG|nr:hypothetical protein BGW38_001554 [Lunasporangiospora selenospora]
MEKNSRRTLVHTTVPRHGKALSSRENTPPLSPSSSPAPSVHSLAENRPQTPSQPFTQPQNEDTPGTSLHCEQDHSPSSQGASSRVVNVETIENNHTLTMTISKDAGTAATIISDDSDYYQYSHPSTWTKYSSSPANLGTPSASSASSATYQGSPTHLTSSLLQPDNESVYAAVPISSEVYIIPKSSRGFHWNGDLFLKPHQRRSLGVDHIFNQGSPRQYSQHSSPQPMEQRYDNGMAESTAAVNGRRTIEGLSRQLDDHGQDSSVMVHEIRLDDHETAGILPSWP